MIQNITLIDNIGLILFFKWITIQYLLFKNIINSLKCDPCLFIIVCLHYTIPTSQIFQFHDKPLHLIRIYSTCEDIFPLYSVAILTVQRHCKQVNLLALGVRYTDSAVIASPLGSLKSSVTNKSLSFIRSGNFSISKGRNTWDEVSLFELNAICNYTILSFLSNQVII